MSLLKVLPFDLETRLDKHCNNFEMIVSNGNIKWVLSCICFSVELKVHCLLNQ